MKNHYNVLFLCTNNSARSIMAEGLMNVKGKPRFTVNETGTSERWTDGLEKFYRSKFKTYGPLTVHELFLRGTKTFL